MTFIDSNTNINRHKETPTHPEEFSEILKNSSKNKKVIEMEFQKKNSIVIRQLGIPLFHKYLMG